MDQYFNLHLVFQQMPTPTVCQALSWTLGRQQGVREMMIPAPMGHVVQQDRRPMKDHSQQGTSSKEQRALGWRQKD